MKILSECKLSLSLAGLGNADFVDIRGKRIPRWMTRAYTLFGQFVLGGIALINSINKYSLGLHAVIYPFHGVVVVITKLAIYIVLMAKTERIAELIDYLEMVVNQRRCFTMEFKKYGFGTWK